jgi:hypothetical protein
VPMFREGAGLRAIVAGMTAVQKTSRPTNGYSIRGGRRWSRRLHSPQCMRQCFGGRLPLPSDRFADFLTLSLGGQMRSTMTGTTETPGNQ